MVGTKTPSPAPVEERQVSTSLGGYWCHFLDWDSKAVTLLGGEGVGFCHGHTEFEEPVRCPSRMTKEPWGLGSGAEQSREDGAREACGSPECRW